MFVLILTFSRIITDFSFVIHKRKHPDLNELVYIQKRNFRWIDYIYLSYKLFHSIRGNWMIKRIVVSTPIKTKSSPSSSSPPTAT